MRDGRVRGPDGWSSPTVSYKAAGGYVLYDRRTGDSGAMRRAIDYFFQDAIAANMAVGLLTTGCHENVRDVHPTGNVERLVETLDFAFSAGGRRICPAPQSLERGIERAFENLNGLRWGEGLFAVPFVVIVTPGIEGREEQGRAFDSADSLREQGVRLAAIGPRTGDRDFLEGLAGSGGFAGLAGIDGTVSDVFQKAAHWLADRVPRGAR